MLYEFSDGIAEYIEEKGFQIDVIPEENRIPESKALLPISISFIFIHSVMAMDVLPGF